MSDVNEVRLSGRLSFDADEPRAAGQSRVLNIKMETTREHRGREFTDRHVVVLWDDLADKLDGAIKGDAIKVQGRLSTRSYEKNGNKVWVTEVVATHVQVAQAQRENDFGPPPTTTRGGSRQPPPPQDDDGSIPF